MAIHQPVLANEAIDALKIVPNGIYIDGTFGQGGHTMQILKKLGSGGQVLAFDKDPMAAAYAANNFSHNSQFKFYCHSFSQLQEIAEKSNLSQKINGILLDLGTSATQLETPDRGFSFLREGPLDMRMNAAQGETAAYWVARMSVNEMTEIFREYGEERWAKRIAEAIVKARNTQPIETTTQLAQIIKAAHPRWPRKIHPATRVFQAIRIHVNREIEELMHGLKQSMNILAPGGRLAVITFHSLEARQVKQFMRQSHHYLALEKTMHWIDRGVKPSPEEIAQNPRSRSAVLRVMEKIS